MTATEGSPGAARSPCDQLGVPATPKRPVRRPFSCRQAGGLANMLILLAIASDLPRLAGEGAAAASASAHAAARGSQPGEGASERGGARCGQRGGGRLALVLRLSGGEVRHGGSDGVIFGNLGQDAEPELEGLNKQLWEAARRGETSKLEGLVKAGAQINAYYETDETEEGTRDTPLHFAVLGGHRETVRELVRLGADVMAADGCENVALHLAAAAGDLEMVKCLVDLECDVRSINMDCKRPMQVAKKYGKRHVYKWLKERERIVAEEEQIMSLECCWREDTPSKSSDDESISEPYGDGTKRLLKDVRKYIKRKEDELEFELPEPDIGPMIDEVEDYLNREDYEESEPSRR